MDQRLAQAPIVVTFADAVRTVAEVRGCYVGGSLASGDYQPAVSDLDLVAVVAHDLDPAQRRRVTALHRRLMRDHPEAAKLHCAYLPADDAADVTRTHLAWTHGEFYRRIVSGVARAELHQFGITVFGPPPGDLIPPVDPAGLRVAARAELTGYWTGAVAKPYLWLEDLYVDLGLITLARVDETLATGALITKRDAIARLDRFGVPDSLVAEIARRRAGEQLSMSLAARGRRARLARRLMTTGMARLLATP